MTRQRVHPRVAMAGLLAALPLSAQDPDLASLFETKVEVATRRVQYEAQAPSIVSVVRREDIERYGWRELADILRALPGFDFADDSAALIGLSERGIWAHEGKALVMVNGLMVSPLHNGNINYYGFLPAELIERVEVIRGPGSAVYGQFAGVTVISILTRGSRDPEGGRFTLRGTTLGGGDHGGGAYVTTSGTYGQGIHLSLTAGIQADPFSRQPYVDTFGAGQSFPQDGGNTRRRNTTFAASVEARGLRLDLLRNEFIPSQVDGGGGGPSSPDVPGIPVGVLGGVARVVQGAGLSHRRDLTESMMLDLSVRQIENEIYAVYPQSPLSAGVLTTGNTRELSVADLTLQWSPSVDTTLRMGGGLQREFERSVGMDNLGGLRDPLNPDVRLSQVTLRTTFGYGELSHRMGPFEGTLGGRYEDSPISHAFAPRIGFTFLEGPFNAKLLVGRAFRKPTLFQTYSLLYGTRTYLKPEKIDAQELELGWRFQKGVQVHVNLYRLRVSDAISSGFDKKGYFILNAGKVCSEGLEGRLEVERTTWGGFLNASWTRPFGDTDPYYLDDSRKGWLGIHPLVVNAGLHATLGAVTLGPTLRFGSSRAVQTRASAQSGFAPGTLMPALVESESLPGRLMLGLQATWRKPLGLDSDVRLGVQNITGASEPLLQPFYGGHAPLPSHDRRVTLDWTWRF